MTASIMRLGANKLMTMSKLSLVEKYFFHLHRLGLIRPFIRYSPRLRKDILRGVYYNTDMVTNQLTYIDLVTDSFKERILSQNDFRPKSYFESSFISLTDTFRQLFGYSHSLPVAQGRSAELVLAKVMLKPEMIIPNNLLFITTRYHQTLAGAKLIEIPVVEAYCLKSDSPFKGNIDTVQLEEVIRKHGKEKIPYILIETAVNASGGHPVSMKNIKMAHHIAKKHNIPLILDACRLLENACLIREREEGYSNKTLQEIVLEFCSYTDGCVMSASKDYYIDTGGFIATNNEQLYNQFLDIVMVIGDGLSVRSKGKLNTAIQNSFKNERIINDRVNKSSYLWKKLEKAGVPVVRPSSGYAVFIDTHQLSEYIAPDQFPEKAFLVHLYLKSGILGSNNLITTGQEEKGIRMIRFAIPLKSYNYNHVNYIAKHIIQTWAERKQIKGLRKVHSAPCLSGQFMAQYQIIE